MVQTYFLVILRNMRRKPFSTSINLTGMALAFAVAMAIFAYASHELSYDRYHNHADRIFRVTYRYHNGSGYDIHWARMSQDWVNELPGQFPVIERLVRLQSFRTRDVIVGEDKYREEYAFAVDDEIFDVFDFHFVRGSATSALTDPYTVVLTTATASRYFGRVDPIGKTIRIRHDDGALFDYKVTGVIESLPPNAHFPVTMLTSINGEQERSGWAYVYVLLHSPDAIASLESGAADFVASKTQLGAGEALTLHFQPLRDIHLRSQLSRELMPNGDVQQLQIFGWVAVFLLVIASVNFANLNTIQVMNRAGELGLRRLLGGTSSHLSGAIYLEAAVLCLFSLAMGAGLFVLGLPGLERFLGHGLIFDPWLLALTFSIILLLVTLFSGALSGGIVTRTQLMNALKGKLTTHATHHALIKKTLIGLQFATVLLLISASMIIHRQFDYMQQKKLGLDHEQVIALTNNDRQVMKDYALLKSRLQQLSGVQDVSAIMELPTHAIKDMGQVKVYDRPDLELSADMQVMDINAPALLDMTFVAGGPLPASLVRADAVPEAEVWNDFSTKDRGYLINETAAKAMGWNDPAEAIGRKIHWSIGEITLKEGYISGVIADYHQESLKAHIRPMVVTYEPLWMRHVLLKADGSSLNALRVEIEKLWDETYPDHPLEVSFLDEKREALYRSEKQQLQLITAFTLVAVVVAVLGLSGMIAFALQLRLKEMAIRRVLGSRIVEVVQLLGQEYLMIAVGAMAVAFPVVWWMMTGWLDHYAYRVSMNGWSLVAAGGVLVLLLAITAMGYALRFQRINPASILKSE